MPRADPKSDPCDAERMPTPMDARESQVPLSSSQIDHNEVVEAILARHSTRTGYVDRRIDEPILKEIVRAGLAAPSSKNAQPWRLHVVSDRTVLGVLAEAVRRAPDADRYVPHDPNTGRPWPQYVSTVRESAEVLAQVSTGVFIENLGIFSGGRQTLVSVARDGLVGSLVGYTLEAVGIGAAVQNMWVAANALGVQAAFMGDILIAEDEIRRYLGLTGDLIGVLALGYADTPQGPRRSLDLDDPTRVKWHGSAGHDNTRSELGGPATGTT